MTRRDFLAFAAAVASSGAVAADKPVRYRVVVRLPWTQASEEKSSTPARIGANLARALADFGYVEGRNLEVLEQHAVADKAAFDAQMARIRSGPVHVLFVFGVKMALAWQERIPGAPIVAWGVMDPVASGLAKDVLRPGGRITGLTQGVHETARKHVDLLREVVPRLGGIALLGAVAEGDILDYQLELKAFEDAIAASGLRSVTVRDAGQGALDALATLGPRGIRAAIYLGNPMPPGPATTRTHADAAIRAGIAVGGGYGHLVDSGFLFSYSESPRDFFLRAAQHVDRVLRSGSAAELPFMAPSRFELHFNVRTAAALGLAVPDGLRIRADRLVGT